MVTLARKIDIRYPTNRWILIIAIIATGVGYFTSQDFNLAWKLGISIFLTWAVTREIDPKREYAAFLAAFFGLAIFFIPFKIDLMVVFFLLLELRYVNRIVGDNNTILDMVTLFVIAGSLSLGSESVVYMLILLVSLLFNRETTKNKKMNTVFYVLTGVLLFVQMVFLNGNKLIGLVEKTTMILSFVSIIVFAIFIVLDKDKSTLGDHGEMVGKEEILKGQFFFAISVGLLSIYTIISSGNLILYLASIWGYIIFRIFSIFKNKIIQA